MNIIINNAQILESNVISELTNELGYITTVHQTNEWLSIMLDSINHGVFVATNEQDTVCGWVAVEKRLSLETGYKAEISGLVVGDQYHRLGIATKLLLACEHWSIQQGLSKLVVSSNIQRQASHEFYKRSGFTHNKTSHKYTKSLTK